VDLSFSLFFLSHRSLLPLILSLDDKKAEAKKALITAGVDKKLKAVNLDEKLVDTILNNAKLATLTAQLIDDVMSPPLFFLLSVAFSERGKRI
jgi:hypothetical protein